MPDLWSYRDTEFESECSSLASIDGDINDDIDLEDTDMASQSDPIQQFKVVENDWKFQDNGVIMTFMDYESTYVRPKVKNDTDEIMKESPPLPLTSKRGQYRKYTVDQVTKLIHLVIEVGQ
jgi:hypothetical protein